MSETNNEFIEQVYTKDIKAIYACLKKYLSYNNFTPILENSYVIIKFNKAEKCLVNLKQLTGHDNQAIQYLNEVWFPMVKKSGIKQVAIILPESITGNSPTQSDQFWVENIHGITINRFDDEIAADKWLQPRNCK